MKMAAAYTLTCKVLFLSMLLLTFVSIYPPSEACDAVDKEALLEFKSKITYDPFKILHSWSDSDHCCKYWDGVLCDRSTGRVVYLIINGGIEFDNGTFVDTVMSRTLSPYLGNLSSLKALGLTNLKDLHGSLPQELAKLSLTALVLSGNSLSGRIPSFLGSMAFLQRLELDHNNFDGGIPATIGNLRNLRTLDFSGNQISGRIPESISNLSQLRILDMARNQISGSLPSSIRNLKNMRTLNLANNKLTGNLPDTIGNLTSLYGLSLANNNFTGQIPPNLANLNLMTTLNLSRNQLSGGIPPQFVKLQHLIYLDLHSNNLTGTPNVIFEKEFQDPIGFNSIDISNNMFSGHIDENIGEKASMSLIDSLVLSHNPLGGSIPVSIVKLNRLQILDLEQCRLSGKIPPELGYVETLKKINLSENMLSGNIPEKLINLKMLKEFNVSRNRLTGKIPPHNANIPVSSFLGNPGLCGSPLPPCKVF